MNEKFNRPVESNLSVRALLFVRRTEKQSGCAIIAMREHNGELAGAIVASCVFVGRLPSLLSVRNELRKTAQRARASYARDA